MTLALAVTVAVTRGFSSVPHGAGGQGKSYQNADEGQADQYLCDEG
jgi:hypothetical protein